MAALGDSMTEALFADFVQEDGLPYGELTNILKIASIQDKEKKMAAFRREYAAVDKSWATGDNDKSPVFSHYQRLVQHNARFEAYNFAVSGADSFDIAPQVEALLSVEEEQRFRFDYVTLFVGANDLGRPLIEEMTKPLEFVANLEQNLVDLLEAEPDRSVLLIGLPDIAKIFRSSFNLVVMNVFGNKLTCDQFRRAAFKNYAVFKVNDPDYYKVENLIDQYRQGSKALVKRLQVIYPKARLKTIQHLQSQQVSKKLLSADCFHPSEWGQAELAEEIWSKGFWPDLPLEF